MQQNSDLFIHAGPLTMLYENGFIRYIRYGESEVIRMIYFTIRDENWGTLEHQIEDEKIVETENGFHISYTCHHLNNKEILFSWEVHIDGTAEGQIRFSICGNALVDFKRNRAGFCILHPVEHTAGNPVIATHGDGEVTRRFFPEYISPDCILTGIQAMEWENSGNRYRIEMKGELFEMEDHRNWTDHSFKTYCTPLRQPFPVNLHAGEQVMQEIIFSPVSELPITNYAGEGPVLITLRNSKSTPMPRIGVEASCEISEMNDQTVQQIKGVWFDFYTVEINTANPAWKADVSREWATAKAVSLTLFVKLTLTENFKEELLSCQTVFAAADMKIMCLLLLSAGSPVTQPDILQNASGIFKQAFPDMLIGAGTDTNFTELNRNRIQTEHADFMSFTIHPQEHAFDDRSLIENTGAQADTVRSTLKLYPSSKVLISAVTLRKRFNPYATLPEAKMQSNGQKADPRQAGAWCAGWTLASLKNLAEAGAFAVSYFQTAGRQGVMDGDGHLFPAGILLRKILSMKEAEVIPTRVSDPLTVTSFLINHRNKKKLFLANHSNNKMEVKLPFTPKAIECLINHDVGSPPVSNWADIIQLPPYSISIVS